MSSLECSINPSSIQSYLLQHHPKAHRLLQDFKTSLLQSFSNPLYDDRRLVATRTVELLRTIIGTVKWRTGAQLLLFLQGLGREIKLDGEPAIGNIVRRVMCAVRDEVEDTSGDDAANKTTRIKNKEGSSARRSLSNVLWSQNPSGLRQPSIGRERSASFKDHFGDSSEKLPPVFHENKCELRGSVMEVIQEIASDLEDLHKTINEQVVTHVHAGEILFTFGHSKTVELFLKTAAIKYSRPFQIIISESAPSYDGHRMALALSSLPNVTPVLIHDSAAFAMMSRVNKVFLAAHAVLANGGLVGSAGALAVALAARECSVPVVVLTGMYKLCPRYPHEGVDTLQDLKSPWEVLPRNARGGENFEDVEVVNAVHDYIPPELISLYVTNVGAFQPSYIYRLLAEYYHPDDWETFG